MLCLHKVHKQGVRPRGEFGSRRRESGQEVGVWAKVEGFGPRGGIGPRGMGWAKDIADTNS